MAGATRPNRRALQNCLPVWWDKYISNEYPARTYSDIEQLLAWPSWEPTSRPSLVEDSNRQRSCRCAVSEPGRATSRRGPLRRGPQSQLQKLAHLSLTDRQSSCGSALCRTPERCSVGPGLPDCGWLQPEWFPSLVCLPLCLPLQRSWTSDCWPRDYSQGQSHCHSCFFAFFCSSKIFTQPTKALFAWKPVRARSSIGPAWPSSWKSLFASAKNAALTNNHWAKNHCSMIGHRLYHSNWPVQTCSFVKAGISWLTWTVSPAGRASWGLRTGASWELDGAHRHRMSSSTYTDGFRTLASLTSCTLMVDPSSHLANSLNSAAVGRSPMSRCRHISHKVTDTPSPPSRQWRCSSWRRPETATSMRTHFVSDSWSGETRRNLTNSVRRRSCTASHCSLMFWPIEAASPAHGKTKPTSATPCIALDLLTSRIAPRHHRPLQLGVHVDIQNPRSKLWTRRGFIVGIGRHRDYTVKLPSGRILWRNRRYLRPQIPAISIPRHDQPAPPPSDSEPPSASHSSQPRRSSRRRQPPTRLNIADTHGQS